MVSIDQLFDDYKGQHCYDKVKGQYVTLQTANLHFLTISIPSINILHLTV